MLFAAVSDQRKCFVYILRSMTTGRYDIASTTDLERRVLEHNSGHTRSTRGRGPWHLIYIEEFGTKAEASERESQLKSWKSRRSIEQLLSERIANQDLITEEVAHHLS